MGHKWAVGTAVTRNTTTDTTRAFFRYKAVDVGWHDSVLLTGNTNKVASRCNAVEIE